MMSRLKTKTINIQPSGSSNGGGAATQESGNSMLQNILSGMTGGSGLGNDDVSLDSSVINVSSLGDIPQDSTPHRSKRRPRSEKNTVSMDL